MDELATNAIAAAVEVAAQHGVHATAPHILKDGSNAMVHLAPAPVVARVATTGSWIRKPVENWLQRDLDLARYLAGQGVPVVSPSADLPPGPHISTPATGSMVMTFWTFVEQDRDHPATDEEAAAALYALHGALKGYAVQGGIGHGSGHRKTAGRLRYLGVLLEELPHWLRWLEHNHALPGSDLLALRQAQWTLAGTLHRSRLPLQALHGDAHSGNLLRTPQGLLWLDFEDACTGPVAWDLATMISRDPEKADSILAAYPDPPSWEQLMPFIEARELEAVIYYQVLARRFPERAPGAAAAFATWSRKWVP